MKKFPLHIVILAGVISLSVALADSATGNDGPPLPLGPEFRDATPEQQRQILEERKAAHRGAREEWWSLSEEEREARRRQSQARREEREERQVRRRLEREFFSQLSDEEKNEFVAARLERVRERGEARRDDVLRQFLDVPSAVPDSTLQPEDSIDQWQVMSVATVGETTHFSFYNRLEDQSFWAELGETKRGIQVVGYSVSENMVEIRHQGETRHLPVGGGGRSLPSRNLLELARNPENWRPEFRTFYTKWERAADIDTELREIDRRYDVLAERMRDNRARMKMLADEDFADSSDRGRRLRKLVERSGEIFAEAEDLTSEMVSRLQSVPDFDEEDLKIAAEMTRPMLLSRSN